MNKTPLESEEQIILSIAPLSVNSAFQGRRYKTTEYDKWIKDGLILMPKIKKKTEKTI